MANPNIVSVANIEGKTEGKSLANSTETNLLTGASSVITKVNCVYVSNTDGTQAVNVTLSFTDTSASATYNLASTVSVPADSTLVVISKNESIYLEETDVLKVTSGHASGKLDVVVSYEEISE
ncbi:MAG: hypothetical protein NZ824_12300 [Candidatus Thioglobus sp.]|nr:hypothetical protein [Candidatus Thioglobus sp.]